jgi:hypothetical protein
MGRGLARAGLLLRLDGCDLAYSIRPFEHRGNLFAVKPELVKQRHLKDRSKLKRDSIQRRSCAAFELCE